MITDNLSPQELAFLVNLIAIEISEGKTTIEIEMIATIYSAIAGQMFLMLAQKEHLEKIKSNNNTVNPVSDTINVNNRDNNMKK